MKRGYGGIVIVPVKNNQFSKYKKYKINNLHIY